MDQDTIIRNLLKNGWIEVEFEPITTDVNIQGSNTVNPFLHQKDKLIDLIDLVSDSEPEPEPEPEPKLKSSFKSTPKADTKGGIFEPSTMIFNDLDFMTPSDRILRKYGTKQKLVLGKKTKETELYYLVSFEETNKKQWIHSDDVSNKELIRLFNHSLPIHPEVKNCYKDSQGFEVELLPKNIIDFIEIMLVDKGPMISVYNDVDDSGPPEGFKCISENEYCLGVERNDISKLEGCRCNIEHERVCRSNCKCSLIEVNGEIHFNYTEKGLVNIPAGYPIVECNKKCRCRDRCLNKVLQKGRQVKLEIFKTIKKGWGVRAMENIKKGAFIIEYVGECITQDEANLRVSQYEGQSTYLFDLDFETEETPLYSLDAKHRGNASRFFNHSCDPNMAVYCVFTEGPNTPTYRIGFFAIKQIKMYDELCFDYNGAIDYDTTLDNQDMSKASFVCNCEASKCRGSFY